MQLEYIPVSDLTPERLLIFSYQLINHTSKPFDDLLGPRLGNILKYCNQLSRGIYSERKSEFTGLLALTDGIRESGFMSFKYAVLSATHSNDSSISSAAEKLQKVLDAHDKVMTQVGYKEQTIALHQMKEKLDKLYTEVKIADVQRQYIEMNNAMDDFDRVYAEKRRIDQIRATNPIENTLIALSRQINFLMQDVQTMLDSGEEGISTLVKSYNQIIESILE